VPPDVVGRAVPEYVIAIDGVMFGLVTNTDKNDGTDAETDVTVPAANEGVVHAGAPLWI
jgi:hypothetical protein